MFIHEVCTACRLTRKAVMYYLAQGLLQPETLENGYRRFSPADVERLQKISILRRLGLSIPHIREILDGDSLPALHRASEKKRLAMEAEATRRTLLLSLAETMDWKTVSMQLDALDNRQSILERLLQAFPGAYGQYLSLHFAPFLNEPIVSDEQREAFKTIVRFLDSVCFELPDDLQAVLEEAFQEVDAAFVEQLHAHMHDAIHHTEAYMDAHQDQLDDYMQLRASDEYSRSPAGRLMEAMRQLQQENGYDTVFIPAMKLLSPAYRAYHEALDKANQSFLQRYPDAFPADQAAQHKK